MALVGQDNARIISSRSVVTPTKKQYLGKLQQLKDYLSQNCPQALDEDNEFKLPLEVEVVISFFGSICFLEAGEDADQDEDERIMKATSTIGQYRSALKYLYTLNKLKFSEELEVSLKTFMAGCRRTVADLKHRGKMKLFEGKRPLSFSGYRLICEKFMLQAPNGRIGSWDQGIFAWCYSVMSWNLICRSITTGATHLEHLSWSNDSLNMAVPSTKSDQEGARDFKYHIYANPLDPLVCPVLALAVYVFTRGYRVSEMEHKLFDGKHSEKRFSGLFRDVLESLTESEKMRLGGLISDLGTHSYRKGAATYALGVEGPNPVMVYLRAGWSLGNVQNRYIFQSKYNFIAKM